MPPEAIEGLMALMGITTLGTIVLVGMRMRLRSKEIMHSKTADDRLVDAVDELYEQNRMLREEVADLQERLDFHERLLVNGEKREPANTPA